LVLRGTGLEAPVNQVRCNANAREEKSVQYVGNAMKGCEYCYRRRIRDPGRLDLRSYKLGKHNVTEFCMKLENKFHPVPT